MAESMELTQTEGPSTSEGHATQRTTPTVHGHSRGKPVGLVLAALGIVFGDIGTSPLYTMKTILAEAGGKPDPTVILGILSLLVWTLLVVATLKYVTVAMSLDNNGEGGILALMSLVTAKRHRPAICAIGLFGAALIYGDGTITPSISVLSALEGTTMATEAVKPYVLPGAVGILFLLFAAQPLGTERIGRAFGPIMAVWFVSIALLGLGGLMRNPSVLAAINPLYAARYLASGGWSGFLVLGAVFLCVTGAEALYADMGHFGSKPIRVAWLGLVFPALVINYAGQAAIVLQGASTDGNIFFQLCPRWLLIPTVVLATLATIIASQSIITGAFSMTRQAIQLGWLPRVAIKHTSAEGYGQIYVGTVNWVLMAATIALTLFFKKSDNLASAYGIAVSLTMALTTVLLSLAMREVLGWPAAVAGAVTAFFLVIDAAFLGANLVKVAEGGYVPLLIAGLVYGVMWVWHSGAQAVGERLRTISMPFDTFRAKRGLRDVVRVPGTAVFLTRSDTDTPVVLLWHLAHNKALQKTLLVLTVKSATVPYVEPGRRLTVDKVEDGFWRAEATFGFMDDCAIPPLLDSALSHGCELDLSDVTYYVGHATIRHRTDGTGIPRWREALYAAMERNATHVSDVLGLPNDKTIELGRQISI